MIDVQCKDCGIIYTTEHNNYKDCPCCKSCNIQILK